MVVKKKFGVRSASNVLSNAQMKLVVAGYGDGDGYGGGIVVWVCPVGNTGTCGWRSSVPGEACRCCVSKSYAESLQRTFGGWYCCDSCGSTAYCKSGCS